MTEEQQEAQECLIILCVCAVVGLIATAFITVAILQ